MSHLIETYEHDGLTVKLYYDEDASSPRENDNLTEMVCSHRNYSLGDREPDGDEREMLERRGLEGLMRYLRVFRDALIVQPLYLYDHSVLRMSTASWEGRAQHASWDSGIVGVVYITRERYVELMGKDTIPSDEELAKLVEPEVAEYDSFLAGEAYGYVIERDGEHVESCWGFIGDIEYVRTEAEWAVLGFKDWLAHRDEASLTQ